MWWWSSGNSSQDQSVKDPPALAVASTARHPPRHFESFSDALATCSELRQLRSFAKLLGRELSAEQYEDLIGSYAYLSSRTLFWGFCGAYPIWVGLSWRRRRVNQKLREQVQYWKGSAKAAASFDKRRVAAGQSGAQPVRPSQQQKAAPRKSGPQHTHGKMASKQGNDSPSGASPAKQPKKHEGSKGTDNSSREVWPPSASGWTKTSQGCKSATRGSTPDAHAKWARAFGGGATGSVRSRLDNENADWEALAAQRAHEQRWREQQSRGDELAVTSCKGRGSQEAPSTSESQPSHKAAKINALLDKDQDLIREAIGIEAKPHVATPTRKGPMHTESVTAYPTNEENDLPPVGTSLLDAFLEHAADEGRLIREQQLARTIRGGKYLVANVAESSANSAKVTSKLRGGRPKSVVEKATVPSDVDVILENEMAWLEDSVARAEHQPSASVKTQGKASEEIDTAIAQALATALHPAETAIMTSDSAEAQERDKFDIQAPGDAGISKYNANRWEERKANTGVESHDVSPPDVKTAGSVDATGVGKDSATNGPAATLNTAQEAGKMQASEGEAPHSSSSPMEEAQPTRRRRTLRQKTKLPPGDAESAAGSSSNADADSKAGSEEYVLHPSVEAGLRRVSPSSA